MNDNEKDLTPEEITPSSHEEVVPTAGEQLAACKDELAEAQKRLLHLQADVENIRRHAQRETLQRIERSEINLLRGIVSLVDDLERGLEAAQTYGADKAELVSGFSMVQRSFMKFLNDNHVTEIATHIPFDPHLHEALMRVEDPEKTNGTIVRVLSKGYRYRQTILRPAQVAVVE